MPGPLPTVPLSLTAQVGNGNVLLTWQSVVGATTYTVQRSLDNATWSTLATPPVALYLDTTGLQGVQYYYQVQAVNTNGVSGYCPSVSAVPVTAGQVTLGQVRLMAQQRADMTMDPFVTTPEWNSYLNQSYCELYDLLVTTYEDYFLAPAAWFVTNGQSNFYPLPDGVTTFQSPTGTPFVAPAFYKDRGVDLALTTAPNAFTSLRRFNYRDRNKYSWQNAPAQFLSLQNMRYRVMGQSIEFQPTPASGQVIQLWYVPRPKTLLLDSDLLDGVSGWSEYVVVDAAIKALQKKEFPVDVLMAQKQALRDRILTAASNRDAGEPEVTADVWSGGSGPDGDGSGFGGGFY